MALNRLGCKLAKGSQAALSMAHAIKSAAPNISPTKARL
jgi:hypothetical protein